MRRSGRERRAPLLRYAQFGLSLMFARQTGAAQIFILLTTIISMNIGRTAVKFFQEKVKSVKEQVEEAKKEGRAKGIADGVSVAVGVGEARGRDAVIAALQKGGMSRDEINAAIIRSGERDLICKIVFEDEFKTFTKAFLEAANRINAASEKTDHVREAQKPESEI